MGDAVLRTMRSWERTNRDGRAALATAMDAAVLESLADDLAVASERVRDAQAHLDAVKHHESFVFERLQEFGTMNPAAVPRALTHAARRARQVLTLRLVPALPRRAAEQ
jgi:hypothetical protein